jgi:hypothetical protein
MMTPLEPRPHDAIVPVHPTSAEPEPFGPPAPGERAVEFAAKLYATTEHERRRERFDLIVERAATQTQP